MTEKALLDLLGFVYKKSDSGEHQKIVCTIFDLILNSLDKISPPGNNDKIDKLLVDIREKLDKEIETAQEVNELAGILDLIESQA